MLLAPDQTPALARTRDGFFVVTLTCLSPISYFAATVFDGARTIRDSTGARVWVSDGNVGTVVAVLGALLLSFLAATVVYRNADLRVSSPGSWVGLVQISALLITTAHLLRWPATPTSTVFYALTATAVIFAAPRLRVTVRDLRLVGRVGAIVATSSAGHLFISDVAVNSCREDKCSAIGGLLKGYFPHENGLALYLALTLPFISFEKSRRLFWIGLAAHVLVIAMTGSRMGLTMAACALLVVSVLRRPTAASTRKWSRLSVLALPTALMFSVGVLVFASPDQLTGRGFIYALTRAELADGWLLGPGREIYAAAFNYGKSAGFLIANEHGQFPYLITNGGVLAALLFSLAMIQIVPAAREQPLVGLLSLPAAVAFITEVVWEVNIRSAQLFFLVLLLCIGSAASNEKARRGERLHA